MMLCGSKCCVVDVFFFMSLSSALHFWCSRHCVPVEIVREVDEVLQPRRGLQVPLGMRVQAVAPRVAGVDVGSGLEGEKKRGWDYIAKVKCLS